MRHNAVQADFANAFIIAWIVGESGAKEKNRHWSMAAAAKESYNERHNSFVVHYKKIEV